MNEITVDQVRAQVTTLVQRIIANDQLDVVVVGSLLVIVLVLSLATIWRNRRSRMDVPSRTPSAASGFTRWLTPMGMASIPAAQIAAAARPARPAGSSKSIRVVTPVSRVPSRALRRSGADALDIARRSGLARDAVVMMMAKAAPRAAAKKAPEAKRAASSDRRVSEPNTQSVAPRAAKAPTSVGPIGTRFTARLS